MIFNTINPVIKKDAMWIPLQSGVQTMAPPPSNWTQFSFTLNRKPSAVALRCHYGGADNYAVIDPGPDGFSFGVGANGGDRFRNVSVTSAKTVNDLPSATPNEDGNYTVELSYPATVSIEVNGGNLAYCPIYDSE